MKSSTRLIALALLALTAACSKSEKGGVTPPPDDTTVTPPPPPPPPPDTTVNQGPGVTLVTAGNIARCRSTDPSLTSNGNADLTAKLIDSMPGAYVLTLGNAANPAGNAANYNGCYAATWGRFKAVTYAAVGNHDYDSTTGRADDFFAYFGPRAGDPGAGYFSFDLDANWHVVILNTNEPTSGAAYYATGSAQRNWMTSDLAANSSKKCTIVALHRTRFYSANSGATDLATLRGLWDDFEGAGVDVVLGAGAYQYERMAPMSSSGNRNDAAGIRQFNVGMGGESANTLPAGVHPNSAKLLNAIGVLKLTLKATTYDWAYIGTDGAVLDSGTGSCH